MGKRLILLIGLALVLGMSTGCQGVVSPVIGILVTDAKWDGDADGPLGAKTGKACAQSILALVATGDASIQKAASNGGITDVKSIDHHSKWTLLFGEYCTIVRGN